MLFDVQIFSVVDLKNVSLVEGSIVNRWFRRDGYLEILLSHFWENDV